jgi:hypothetical protein
MGALLRELGRFSRRNVLAAAGGFMGLLIVFVAIAAPIMKPRLARARCQKPGGRAGAALAVIAGFICRWP